MLVLARKKSEIIKIGDNIVITVVDVRGQITRLGIDAPKEILILRGELEQRPEELHESESDVPSTGATETVTEPADA